MKESEQQCLNILRTIEIKALLNNIRPASESAFSTFLLSEVKRLSKLNSLSGEAKRYIFKHINPKLSKGLFARWSAYLATFTAIETAMQNMSGLAHIERLKLALDALHERGFATGFDTPDEMTLEGDDHDRLLAVGCIMLPSCIVAQASAGNFDGIVNLYYLATCNASLSAITSEMQKHGFGIYLAKRPYTLNKLAVLDVYPSTGVV